MFLHTALFILACFTVFFIIAAPPVRDAFTIVAPSHKKRVIRDFIATASEIQLL
jgi:hypothetical protein